MAMLRIAAIVLVVSTALALQQTNLRRVVAGNYKDTQLQSTAAAVGSQHLIDAVYCWAGESMQVDDSAHAGESMQERALDMSIHAGWGFNEFQVSFRSLLKYAPWFNKVYVLVNGPAHPPAWAANETRLVMVDRCTLFPRGSGDCPTNNSYACNSVAHLIPGLKEHFVFMEDDYYFVRPVNSSQFFSPVGTPLVDFSLNTGSFEEVYGARADLSGPDMPPEHLPLHMINDDTIGQHAAHSPMPIRVSFLKSMESKFSDWFAFLRSHRNRFISLHTEDYQLVYYWMLFANKAGEQRPGCRGTPCKCDETLCVVDCLLDPNTMVINFNDQSVENWRIVHDLVVQRMESFIVPSWFSSWRVWSQSSRFQLWQHLLATPVPFWFIVSTVVLSIVVFSKESHPK